MEQCILNAQQNLSLRFEKRFKGGSTPFCRHNDSRNGISQVLHTRLPPQCNTNSPPNLRESPLATAARLFSQLQSVPHPSFAGEVDSSAALLLSARVNRLLINGSQGVQSPGATVQSLPPECVSWSCFHSCEAPFSSLLRYNFSRQLPNTPSGTPLAQTWSISRGPGRGRNQRRAFVKIRARNERKLTNVIRPERLRLGGPIISNRPPVRFVCSSTCVFCMCEKSQMLETDFVSSQRSWDKKKKKPGCNKWKFWKRLYPSVYKKKQMKQETHWS